MTPILRAIVLRGALIGAALLLLPLYPGSGPAGHYQTWRYAAALAEPAPSDPAAAEKEAFEAAKQLGTVEAWDAFLSHHPTGFHADLARAYVKKLGQPDAKSPAASAAPSAPALVAGPSAQELPCSKAEKLSSENSDKPAKIRFVNESGATLVIQWIDFKGRLKEYATLQPGAELTQDTFLTHPWIAAYQEGSCRQLFLPGEGTTVARLLPEDQLSLKKDEPGDHGPTPEQTCKDSGMDYDGAKCVARKKASGQPSKATIERRAKAACVDIGMIYVNGKCAPKKKSERDAAANNKNKPCPAGTYRNPYGQCQPNETGN
jgi:hypothetical protein